MSYGNQNRNYAAPRRDGPAPANGGNMFPRQKRTNNSPDMGGDFTIGDEVLDYILECLERGEVPVKLDIAGWKKQGRNSTFMGVKVSIPYSVRNPEAGQNRPTQPPVYGNTPQGGNSYAQARQGGPRPPMGNEPYRPRQQPDRIPDFDQQDEFSRGDLRPDEKLPWEQD